MGWLNSLSETRALALILFVRIASVFIVQTWYVPDEYWQSVEVGHRVAFGYGELTWEWARGVRSYLHPVIIAALYKALYFLQLDYAEVVVLAPRILQAVVSSLSDLAVYKWCGNRRWALFLILTQWFWFYTATRTLANTLETALFGIALSIFPFKDGKRAYYAQEDNRWIWLAVVSCHMRPTAAVLWAPLVVYNLLTTNQPKLRLLAYRYLPITVISLSVLTAIDSHFHGSLVFTPWEFFKVNVLNGVGSFYGEHPWYWYVTVGLPVVLGVSVLPAAWAVLRAVLRPTESRLQRFLVAVAALHVAVHSFIPHKEFRFLLPLLPIFTYLIQDVVVPWSRKARSWQLWSVLLFLAAGNIAPAVYTGVFHQRGTTQVMSALRDIANHNPKASFSFLMPCHSTPLYSHLHVNVTTRYLSCEPPLDGSHGDESEFFYQNPARWWEKEKALRPLPTHVVLFHSLLPRLQAQLREYKIIHEVPHTQFPEGRVSETVLVLERVLGQAKPSAPADEAL